MKANIFTNKSIIFSNLWARSASILKNVVSNLGAKRIMLPKSNLRKSSSILCKVTSAKTFSTCVVKSEFIQPRGFVFQEEDGKLPNLQTFPVIERKNCGCLCQRLFWCFSDKIVIIISAKLEQILSRSSRL